MEARDYIAIITIVGGMTLLALGVDSFVGAILIAVVSYYFGMGHRDAENRLKKGRLKEDPLT